MIPPNRILLLSAALLGPVAVWAQTPRSPFMPPPPAAGAAPVVAATPSELQFCGVFGDGEDKRFCIYNQTARRTAWLRLGEEGPGEIVVETFDAENRTVQVAQGGRSLTLALQAAVGVPAAGSPAMAGGPAGAGSGSALVNTVKVNPTPADERRRLDAVAAEVRRRRAMRAAAANGQAAPEAVQTPPR